MDKLKYIKIENEDGSLSDNIPLGVDAENVDTNDGSTVEIELNNLKNKDSSQDNSINNLNNKINIQDNSINNLKNQINSLASGSPLAASSVSEMTDTTKIYVNTNDGHWYYYNGTNWADGGVYQGMELSDKYKDILFKLQSEIIENTYTPELNGYFHIDGYIIGSGKNQGKHTDYIEIGNYDKIEYNTYLNNQGYEIAFFDEAKQIIDNISIPGDNTIKVKNISIPTNAKYVMLSYYNSDLDNPYMRLYKTDSIYSKVNSLINDNYNIIDDVDNLNSEIIDITEKPNLVGYITSSGFLNNTNNARHTDYIPIKKGYNMIEYKSYLTNAGYEIAFYDSNKNILKEQSILGNGSYATKTLSIPTNAKYIILSVYKMDDFPFENAYIKLYNSNSLSRRIDNISTNNIIKDKNILIFGDSITDCCNFGINYSNKTTTSYSFKNPSNSFVNEEGQTINYSMWPKLLRNLYNPKEIRNYAKSGAQIRTFVTTENSDNLRQNLSYQVDLALNDLNNPNNVFKVDNFIPDIIIFAIGTNDGATPNDTYDTAMEKTIENNEFIDVEQTLTNLDTSYFNQSLRYNFLRLKNKFPYAQIFFVLPLQKQASRNLEEQKIKDIIKMCEAYSINIIDGAKHTGIIMDLAENKDIYFKDGLHPNDKGQNLMTRTIIKSIENNYLDMSDMNP